MNFIDIMETKESSLSPFSPHRIDIWDTSFPTAEHAYQAARIKPGKEREEIRSAASPGDAWRLGQKHKKDSTLRSDAFDKDAVMEEIFRAKISQHPDVESILKESGGATILKNHPDDYYWGTGADGSGQNEMGKLWMRLRSELL